MDDNKSNNPLSQTIPSSIEADQQVVSVADPLTLDLDDKVFISTLATLEKEYDNYVSEHRINERREENKKYLFGRQYEGKKFKDYEEAALYLDNIIYESESYITPMATQQLPDIVVKPGSDSEQSKDTAKKLSKIVSSDIQSRERKKVLKLAFRHHPVYLVGIIKCFWDPTKGKDGDYNFKVVHPSLVKFDVKATTNNTRDMRWFEEEIAWTVKEWIMKFPKKKDELIQKLHTRSIFNGSKNENTEAGLNSIIQGKEVWFTWYKDKGNNQFERQECVAWIYDDLVMGKMLSPNWDWKGDEQVFSLEEQKAVTPEAMQQALMQLMGGDQNAFSSFSNQQVYHNHLDYPDKPYKLLGYDQWGESPFDETSRIEQVIQMQKAYDKRQTEISSMITRGRGKHVFSSAAGTKKEDYEELDWDNPNDALFITGDISKAHAFIQPELPSPAIIQTTSNDRERIFDKMGVHGPARGEVDMGSPATNNQLSREGDFTRSDDLTDDTINATAEWMANWELQLIKLRYSENHFKRLLGQDGQEIFERINGDLIEDGMEVEIGASGTDKLKAKQQAMDEAKLQMIDPFTFYTDVQDPDPKTRTERLALWSDPNMRQIYLQSVGIDIASLASGALGAVTPTTPGQDQGTQQAQSDIMQIQQGQIPPPPQQVTPGYLQTFNAFMNDPQGAQALIAQNPMIKDQLLQFAQTVAQLAQNMSQSNQPAISGGQPSPDGMAGPQTGSVGPLSSQPTPTNTAQIAAIPAGRA